MNSELKLLATRMLEINDEIERYILFKNRFLLSHKSIFSRYQDGKIDHESYMKEMNHLEKGKSKKYWVDYYDSYVAALAAEARQLNSQLAYAIREGMIEAGVSSETDEMMSKLPAPYIKGGLSLVKDIPLEELKKRQKGPKRGIISKMTLKGRSPKSKTGAGQTAGISKGTGAALGTGAGVSLGTGAPGGRGPAQGVLKRKGISTSDEIYYENEMPPDSGGKRIKRIVTRRLLKEIPDKEHDTVKDYLKVKGRHDDEPVYIHKDSALKSAFEIEKKTGMKADNIKRDPEFVDEVEVSLFTSLWDLKYIKHLLLRLLRHKTKKKGRKEDKSYLSGADESEEYGLEDTLISEEAIEIERIIKQKKLLRMHKTNKVSQLANLTLSTITANLIESFPGLFKNLYTSLRLANMNILSNTYANIMIFFSLLALLISFPLFGVYFLISGNEWSMLIVKTISLSVSVGGIVLFGFYSYPGLKVKSREQNIENNLPFAINHISAVATSGVEPLKMFRLISDSEEYGEISKEFAKIVEYSDLLGYDLLTAMKSVSSITPNSDLKEFFEGFVSTIESGGDIINYLKQESNETMIMYELRREKYNQLVSTASDVYTGIMLAAPLFFIVTLTMVSILGGKVMGFEADTLIAIGTYAVIPFLNILFIMFFSLKQPGN